ncbi:HEPN domain-containing protein [Candidatus Pacearchaeota archaeon]|nr:HEPN domain-containing protein [Candidatus Pacearchaeota archaeon]
MDSKDKLLIERAEHEIVVADLLYSLSNDSPEKTALNVSSGSTFYSAVISHAYYAIFYSAKYYLLSKNILIPEQGQHNFVYQRFKKLAKTGELDKELLEIYKDTKIKAEALLLILESEEEKRTEYTYKTYPQANKLPAEKSLENAKFFVSHIRKFVEKY